MSGIAISSGQARCMPKAEFQRVQGAVAGKKILITGATSGIGEAFARECVRQGHLVLLTGRRTDRLLALKEEFGERALIATLDVTKAEDAWAVAETLIRQAGGMDILVVNAGVSNFQGSAEPSTEQWVIDVNVSGFAAFCNRGFRFFEEQGHGQIVGISSVAGMFGYGLSAAYCASKAFVSTYMQGYRQKARRSKADITVTDVRPGYVESEMTAGKKGMFWVVPADYAAVRLLQAIEARKARAYIPRRWALIGWMLSITPGWMLDRL
jgi:short-subunit dehydrogenase